MLHVLVANDKSLTFRQFYALEHHYHHHHQFVRKSVPSATIRALTNVGHACASKECREGLANATGPRHRTAIWKEPANSELCFLLFSNISRS